MRVAEFVERAAVIAITTELSSIVGSALNWNARLFDIFSYFCDVRVLELLHNNLYIFIITGTYMKMHVSYVRSYIEKSMLYID